MPSLAVECLFDGRRFRTGPWRVSMRGDQISQLNQISDDAVTVEGRGKTLLPGLIDAHVHLTLDASIDPVTHLLESTKEDLISLVQRQCRILVAAGVTTVRDCGSSCAMVEVFRGLSNQPDQGYPTILAAGMPVTTPNGHGHFFGAGVEHGRLEEMVDTLASANVDLVKVMVTGGGLTPGSDPCLLQYDEPLVRRIVARARSHGLSVAAHVHTEEGVLAAARAGVRTIEHATGLRPQGIGLSADVGRTVADAGAYVVPTLAGFVTACRRRIRGVQRTVANDDPERLIEERVAAVRTLIECGNRFVAGTDAGARLLQFDSLAEELRAIHEAGLEVEDTLAAATSTAAECLGLADRGAVRVSARADLIVVDGTTAAAVLDHIEHPDTVIVAGREVHNKQP